MAALTRDHMISLAMASSPTMATMTISSWTMMIPLASRSTSFVDDAFVVLTHSWPQSSPSSCFPLGRPFRMTTTTTMVMGMTT
jgi:hypothetical protein